MIPVDAREAGEEAYRDGAQPYENPFHPVREHELFAQWRDGWHDAANDDDGDFADLP